MIDTINITGQYCGRFSDGFAGELQNSLSNIAFVAAAGLGFAIWRSNANQDGFQLALVILAALIGIGSFTFHSAPGMLTLQFDLIPIQLFGLAAFFYLARREFELPILGAFLAIAVFFLARQGWVMIAPRGALGGGITHIPTVILLVGCGIWLSSKGKQVGRYLIIAAGFYVVALAARTADLLVCSRFPLGVHWMWHILTAAVVGSVLIGLMRCQNDDSSNEESGAHG
ncbi:MAG: ceramidase [Rhodobacteraceae bacterium]|nr:ceramidase [Paracoccaceae bacterium]